MSTPPSKPRKKSATISLLVKVLLTAAAFWLAFRGVEWDKLEEILSEQTLFHFAVAAGCVLSQIILGALRWRYIMAALSDAGKQIISFAEAFRIYYISVFFSNCLPGTIGGDVVRVWITRSDRISLWLSVNSIIIDRLLALTGVLLLVLLAVPVLSGLFDMELWPYAVGFLVLAAIGSVIVIAIDHALKRFEHIKVILWLRQFFNCLRLLIRNPGMSLYSLIFASLSHVFYGVCAYMLATGMGVDMSLLHSVVLMPLVMLAVTMPVSIAGWGVREMVMVNLLVVAGVNDTAAIAISLQLGILNILVSLPAALLWLTFKRKQKEQMQAETTP